MKKLLLTSAAIAGLFLHASPSAAQRQGGGLFGNNNRGGGLFGGNNNSGWGRQHHDHGNHQHNHHPPFNDNSNFPARIAGEIAKHAIESGIRELRRSSEREREYRQPRYQYYTPSETVFIEQPAVTTTVPQTTPTNSIPQTTATPPANVVEPKPIVNKVTRFQSANKSLANKLDRAAERIMDDALAEIEDVLLSEQELVDQLEKLKAGAPPAATASLDRMIEAVKKRDAAKVAEAADALQGVAGVNENAVKQLKEMASAQVDTRKRLEDLQDAVDSGASPREIRDLALDLQDSIRSGKGSLGISASQMRALERESATVAGTAILRETIDDAMNDGLLNDWPSGTVDVLTVSGLPGLNAGQTMGIGPNLIVVDGATDDGWQLEEGVAEDYLDATVVAASPVPEAAGTPTSPNAVVVINPATSGGDVTFTAAGQTATLKPGFQLEVKEGLIEFDRGGDHGTARYTLAPGTFNFRSTPEEGWDLTAKQYQIVIDNSKNRNDFNYVIGPKTHVVRAGESATHTSSTVIQLVFDRGDGKPASRKELADGTYVVAVNAETKSLDVFPAEVVNQAEIASAIDNENEPERRSRRDRSSSRRRSKPQLPSNLSAN